MEILDESDIDATTLLSDGVTQLFSFGPGLIENGQISVSAGAVLQLIILMAAVHQLI